MADTFEGADTVLGQDGEVKGQSTQKRRSTDSADSPAPAKKTGLTPAVTQKISFNLSSAGVAKSAKVSTTVPSKPVATAATVAPIRMALNPAQKNKEPPPVVQKSALAAKVFDDSDESDEEEMPPEAKMRMKNIGRDTPTASGPNSYGKGKQGFIDRQKIIEKQLKEEMEKMSGDNLRQVPK